MESFRALYTPKKWEKASTAGLGGLMPDSDNARTVSIVKVCEPKPGETPKVVFIDSNGDLGIDTMNCFSECR